MKKDHFDGLVSGMSEVRDFLEGRPTPGLIVHIPADIDAAAIRKKAGFSQATFASCIGISVATLRNWEQGRRVPDGPARVLLSMLDRNPQIVLETLGEREVA